MKKLRRTQNTECRTKTRNPLTNYRPTWVEIDLNAIKYNFFQLKKLLKKNTAMLIVVKANAYGHGILEVSKALVKAGVDYLGVATTDEAILLRENNFNIPILTLGGILKPEISAVIKNNITQTVHDIELARNINISAARLNKKAKVHIKIDVGMGRIGVWHENAIEFMKKVACLKNIEIEGIFSHFPSADEDRELTISQIERFRSILQDLKSIGIKVKYRHIANSTAVTSYKDSHMDLVRPGLMVYGLYPKRYGYSKKIDLRPALSLKSRIVFIKDVPSGRRISYGGTYTTNRQTKIATIPIGYGDGFSRSLSNKGYVLIKGKRSPILGRICMDQIMVDIGHIDRIEQGEEVVLIGEQKRDRIRVEDIAHLCGTIPYEVVCWLDNRIQRIYKK